MIRVMVGNNIRKSEHNVPASTTLRQAFELEDVDYERGLVHFNGAPIAPGELDKSLAELGYDGGANHDRCFLFSITKTDNGIR